MTTSLARTSLVRSVRRAFTLIELMVVLGVIALLVTIVLLGLRHVKSMGDAAAERAMLSALRHGLEEFRKDFGFLPPLVVDSPSSATVPVAVNGSIAVWDTKNLYDPNTTLNGSGGPTDRRCYSVYSLPYYLCGACDELIDGVDGLGFTAPSSSHDGSFSKRGRKHEPLLDVTTQKTRSGLIRLSARVPAAGDAPADQLNRARNTWIYDRWSDGSGFAANDRAIRYYRWLPSYYTDSTGLDPAPSAAEVGKVHFWNVPFVVGGSFDNLAPPANIELKSAEWAIVSAGPDHLFGDEDVVLLRNVLGLPLASPAEEAAARQSVAKDNIVEVGR